MNDTCVVCQGERGEATRIVSWETPTAPIWITCDRDALAIASQQFEDWQNITIRPLDLPFGLDEDEIIND